MTSRIYAVPFPSRAFLGKAASSESCLSRNCQNHLGINTLRLSDEILHVSWQIPLASLALKPPSHQILELWKPTWIPALANLSPARTLLQLKTARITRGLATLRLSDEILHLSWQILLGSLALRATPHRIQELWTPAWTLTGQLEPCGTTLGAKS